VSADCLKLTSYFGERHRAGGVFTADALLDLYGRSEMAASILLRGTEGFGLRQHLRTDRSLTLSEDLPLVAVAVDTRPRIEAVLEQTLRLNSPGLVTLERAILLDGTDRADGLRPDPADSAKLTVYLGRRERAYRAPAFVAVCDLLYRRGIAGATALLRQHVHDELTREMKMTKKPLFAEISKATAGGQAKIQDKSQN